MNLLQLLIKLIIVSFLAGLFFSCEKEIERPLSNKEFNTIVIESILTNEYKYQKVILSLPSATQNQMRSPVSSATVSISSGDQEIQFTESSTEKGSYYSNEKFAASISKTYQLQINANGTNYNASTSIIAVSNYNPIDIKAISDSSYKLNSPTSSYNPSEQAMFELDLSWFADSLVQIKTYRYQLNTLDVSIVFSPEEENIIFPKGTMIIGKKYSLTDDYAAYIRAMLAETHWQGGLFDDEKADLPTNISNGGLGYFTACSVVVDTLIVE